MFVTTNFAHGLGHGLGSLVLSGELERDAVTPQIDRVRSRGIVSDDLFRYMIATGFAHELREGHRDVFPPTGSGVDSMYVTIETIELRAQPTASVFENIRSVREISDQFENIRNHSFQAMP